MAVADDLAKIDISLQGVVVPAGYPAIGRIYQNPTEKVVTTAELPCFLILPRGDPEITFATFGVEQETVTYAIQFLYQPVSQGTLNENFTDTLVYRVPTLNAIYSHITLSGTVNWVLPIRASLPRELLPKWGGLQFIGFEIILRTVDRRAITLAA